MTRRALLGCLVFAALGVAAGLLATPRAISPASYGSIRAGMSKEEVESVIGLPAGDYYIRPRSGDWRAPYWGLRGQGGEKVDLWSWTTKVRDKDVSVQTWRGNHYILHVAFDETDSAIAWSIHEILTMSESTLEQIRMWFAE